MTSQSGWGERGFLGGCGGVQARARLFLGLSIYNLPLPRLTLRLIAQGERAQSLLCGSPTSTLMLREPQREWPKPLQSGLRKSLKGRRQELGREFFAEAAGKDGFFAWEEGVDAEFKG